MEANVLRIEIQLRKSGGPRFVYVRKCKNSDCNSEIKTRANTNSSGMCKVHAQRKRPFESIYNGIKNDWRGTEVELTYEEYLEFTNTPNCHYCKALIPWKAYGPRAYYLDRKDNDKGYSKENCVVCCTECNIAKGNRYTYEEWKAAMKAVLEVREMTRHRSEFEDRIKGAPLTEKCSKCGKAICDEEYVVCWTWCDSCLSASLDAFEDRRKHANESQQ